MSITTTNKMERLHLQLRESGDAELNPFPGPRVNGVISRDFRRRYFCVWDERHRISCSTPIWNFQQILID